MLNVTPLDNPSDSSYQIQLKPFDELHTKGFKILKTLQQKITAED